MLCSSNVHFGHKEVVLHSSKMQFGHKQYAILGTNVFSVLV